MGRRFVSMATIRITHMLAPRMVSTVRSGLQVECLLAPARGIAGAMQDTGAAAIGAMAATTDVGLFEGTNTATREGTTVITMPGTMPEEGTDVVTLAADSMAAELSAAAGDITVEAVASTVVVGTGK
jgi:hypothetical protein